MAVDVTYLNSNSTTNIDTNFERTKEALEKALGREGDLPNHMETDLDMNSNDILNVNVIQANDITIDGSDATGILERALEAVEGAEIQADRSENEADRSTLQANRAAENALAVVARAWFKTVPDLLADNNSVVGYTGSGADFIVSPGDIIEAQGFRYEVQSAAADPWDEDTAPTGYHVITAGGVKLRVEVNGVPDCVPFGALPDDDTIDCFAIFTKVIAEFGAIHLPKAEFFGSTTWLIDKAKYIYSDGATLWKNFNGIGMRFSGGSQYNYVIGDLRIAGYGAFAQVPGEPSISTTAHGVLFYNCRMRIRGQFRSEYHGGDGFRLDHTLTTQGNRNKCEYRALWAKYNGVNGIRAAGAGHSAVVYAEFYTQFNNERGIRFDGNSEAQKWDCFWYAESNDQLSAGHPEVELARMGDSRLWVYAENTSGALPAGVDDMYIGGSCYNLEVFAARQHSVINYSSTVNQHTGGLKFIKGTNPSLGKLQLPNFTNSDSTYTEYEYIMSHEQLVAVDRIYGDRRFQREVRNPTSANGAQFTQSPNGVVLAGYGNVPILATAGWGGTLDSPSGAPINSEVSRRSVEAAVSSVATVEAFRETVEVTNVAPGVRNVTVTWSLAPNGSTALENAFQWNPAGDYELLRPGRGIVLASPNGTRYHITVDNDGNLTTSAL